MVAHGIYLSILFQQHSGSRRRTSGTLRDFLSFLRFASRGESNENNNNNNNNKSEEMNFCSSHFIFQQNKNKP